MSAQNAVLIRTRCKGCGNLSTEQFNPPGSVCDLKVETKTIGRVKCSGIYSLTVGQQFKNRFGYSRTLAKNMRKHGLDPNEFSDSIAAYREIRKKRKKQQKAVQRAKHDAARAHRAVKASQPKTGKKKK